VLRASATPVRLGPALRAYLISHLGKYVPGKAMVVVVRAGLVVQYGARASTAAIATFYETLVMMAAGGMIAAVGFATASGSQPVALKLPGWGQAHVPFYKLVALLGLGLGLGFFVLVLPPVFVRLARLVSLPIPGVGPEALPRLTFGLLCRGSLWSAAGWILLGFSQLAVVRAFDRGGAERLFALGLVPMVIAAVALATIAGFVVAVLPGGLGVREGVLMSVLAPVLGAQASVIAALVLRLVWVIAEVCVAALLFAWLRPKPTALGPPVETGQSAP
jgi:glycosyltransferase 2 family protein